MESMFKALSQGLTFPSAPKRARKSCILTRVPDPKYLKASAIDTFDEKAKSDKRERKEDREESAITLLDSLQSSSDAFVRRKKAKKTIKPVSSEILREERVNRFRNSHRIRVRRGDNQGDVADIPEPLISWETLENMEKSLIEKWPLDLLKTRYSSGPTPVQMQTWPAMMRSQELLVCAPTGSGKTFAYLLPLITLIESAKKALVIVPTRELALQIGREAQLVLKESGLSTLVLDSANAETRRFDSTTLEKFDLLVSTPNRIVYLIRYDNIELEQIKYIIVDEADRLFEAGFEEKKKKDSQLDDLEKKEESESKTDAKSKREEKTKSKSKGKVKSKQNSNTNTKFKANTKLQLNQSSNSNLSASATSTCFRDQLHFILSHFSSAKRFFFSATLTSALETYCKAHLSPDWLLITIGIRNTACSNVKQRLIYTKTEKGKLVALNDLVIQGLKPPILIFVQSKSRAKELHEELLKLNLRCDAIHSDQALIQRDQAVQGFRSGRIWMLICTDLMARGIDFKGVNVVINYDLPNSTLSYIHRVGRTGRAGRDGEAITFFTDQDRSMMRSIAQVVKDAGSDVPEYMFEMRKCSREEKKRRANRAVKRPSVNPRATFERKQKEKKKAIIEGSKRRKAKRELEENMDDENNEKKEKTKTVKLKKKKKGGKKRESASDVMDQN